MELVLQGLRYQWQDFENTSTFQLATYAHFPSLLLLTTVIIFQCYHVQSLSGKSLDDNYKLWNIKSSKVKYLISYKVCWKVCLAYDKHFPKQPWVLLSEWALGTMFFFILLVQNLCEIFIFHAIILEFLLCSTTQACESPKVICFFSFCLNAWVQS